ncbi:hypothetical protein AB5J62_15080 [Amycolatopsis sp. cg5]|uniref:hypothetical protein n=1 Tax=Amycolatopsis sp. cg5 TaxID=3238802 RepID=UPI003524AD36
MTVRQQIPGNGCLKCSGLIDATGLALDMLPENVQEQARYIGEVPTPSVIALNSVAAGEAVNHFMFAVANLHTEDREHSVLQFPRDGQRTDQRSRRDPHCRTCSHHSSFASGSGN